MRGPGSFPAWLRMRRASICPPRTCKGETGFCSTLDPEPGNLFPRPAAREEVPWLLLDFGPGTREPLPSPPGAHNMRAYLQGPIREAAQVHLNGKAAGVVWHPPYRLDVTPYQI